MWAVKGEKLRNELLYLVDEDTRAFDRIMAAMGLPKGSDAEKAARKAAMTKPPRVPS
jgi:glutamate formiminotransferase/formiminotetrahydrofolate cyclodeaminase